MGCASWRAHFRLREHAGLAPTGGTITQSRTAPVLGSANILGLNEVGVTDLVMATIWRFGPNAAAYAVSAAAEANHLGADIAIIQPGSHRLVLYQAKIARLVTGTYRLKSRLTPSQIRLLSSEHVTLQGSEYLVTGRLALYQVDHTPFLHRCVGGLLFRGPDWWWPGDPVSPDPNVGRQYYEDVLAGCGCSPSGVLASPVPLQTDAAMSLPALNTWPWEFDIYEWLRGFAPLDDQGNRDERRLTTGPRFEPYLPTTSQVSQEQASAMATELARRLRLPRTLRLYVVVLG
jgi:hypothetical protein